MTRTPLVPTATLLRPFFRQLTFLPGGRSLQATGKFPPAGLGRRKQGSRPGRFPTRRCLCMRAFPGKGDRSAGGAKGSLFSAHAMTEPHSGRATALRTLRRPPPPSIPYGPESRRASLHTLRDSSSRTERGSIPDPLLSENPLKMSTSGCSPGKGGLGGGSFPKEEP